jgi:DNA-binding NtrC family response regulator
MPRILLIDDDIDVQLYFEQVLTDSGYEVDTISTMKGGTELLRSRRYDLVLSDGKLPDGTGMDVADIAFVLGTRTLIITGYAFTLPGETRERYEIIPKPISPIEIVSAVEGAIRRSSGLSSG